MKIGTHYDKHNYNCANFVADWYNKHLDIEIPVINEFDRSFIVWMRRNFNPVKKPTDHCLVLMVEPCGSYHIGVYYEHGVYHNFKPVKSHGSVVKSTLGSIKANYTKVSFHKWS